MPKDEFDPEDPMELFGVGVLTDGDTMDGMTECFIEEYLRMHYNHHQILALFHNPNYVGPHLVLRSRGDPSVRNSIAVTFARWGRAIRWENDREGGPVAPTASVSDGKESPFSSGAQPAAVDPLGGIIPQNILGESL